VCDLCRQKSKDLARLARFFRDNGRQTPIAYYRDIMAETAEELDDLSRYYAKGCRCGEPPAQLEAAQRPDRGRLPWTSPPLRASSLAGETAARADDYRNW